MYKIEHRAKVKIAFHYIYGKTGGMYFILTK